MEDGNRNMEKGNQGKGNREGGEGGWVGKLVMMWSETSVKRQYLSRDLKAGKQPASGPPGQRGFQT